MRYLILLLACCAHSKPETPASPPIENRVLAPPPARPPEPTLAVTGIEPNKGDADGGTYVKLTGTKFLEGPPNAKIYFGSHQGTIVRFASDSEIIAEAPGGKVGEIVDVLLIFEARGEIKLPHAFTYVEKPHP
jgi:hypothetical protein